MSDIIVHGAGGRMGKYVLQVLNSDNSVKIAAAVDYKDHPDLGKDAGILAGLEALNVPLSADFPAQKADVIIDFSLPQALDRLLEYSQTSKTPLILCTTGLDDSDLEKAKKAAKSIPIVQATNMSVGMNLLFSIVGKVAAALGPDYDVEIVEAHHRYKKDSPSGTALTLAEKICDATGRDYPGHLVHGRHTRDEARTPREIGMHAVRGGDIVGKHEIILSTLGETLTLSHNAHSRKTFAIGALRATKWIIGKPAGLYSMIDVLGLDT